MAENEINMIRAANSCKSCEKSIYQKFVKKCQEALKAKVIKIFKFINILNRRKLEKCSSKTHFTFTLHIDLSEINLSNLRPCMCGRGLHTAWAIAVHFRSIWDRCQSVSPVAFKTRWTLSNNDHKALRVWGKTFREKTYFPCYTWTSPFGTKSYKFKSFSCYLLVKFLLFKSCIEKYRVFKRSIELNSS